MTTENAPITPVLITMGKTYEYRNGKPARILCVDRAIAQGHVTVLHEI